MISLFDRIADRLPFRVSMNPPVFLSVALLTISLVLFSALFTQQADLAFTAVHAWVTNTAGWFYVLVVAGFLIFVILLAFSSYGTIRLGPDHSQPDYSYGSWFAMLFSAGMGIGLMFFGVAEPVMHYVVPPAGDPETVDAARQALRVTFFHWGLHAWAIYAVVAMSLAYFSFRHGLPLTIRSSLYPLIGDRIYGPIGHTVDTFAVVGTLFGVATSLGLGVMQINSGLNYLFGLSVSMPVQAALIAFITLIATGSVAMGLDGGIRRLSVLNMVLAGALLLFVLVTGPTVLLMQTLVQNTGNYISGLFEMTFNLYAYEPSAWIGGWTLFYWGWWIAWAPFVGMFIARVSRGRTIREFTIGVLLVPMGFTLMWMTFFGNTAIHMIMNEGLVSLAEAVLEDESVALFQFLEQLPLSGLTSLIATLLVMTFFVTSSDSGSLVIDILTSGGEDDSPTWQRVFWAVLEGILAAGLLAAGGLAALQTATIASALPFAIIMILMCWGLMRSLRIESIKRSSLSNARVMPATPAARRNWQTRLRSMMHHPNRVEVLKHIRDVVQPALESVAAELQKQQLDARVEEGENGEVWIEINQGSNSDFYYSVHPRAYELPGFIMRDVRDKRRKELEYYQAEVHLREGGQDYDLMGWGREDVIDDVLEHYQRHMHFLAAVR